MTVKDLSYTTIINANTLYLIINKINEYIEESNGNRYLTLVASDESKVTLRSMKNYGTKSEILLDQELVTQAIIMENI